MYLPQTVTDRVKGPKNTISPPPLQCLKIMSWPLLRGSNAHELDTLSEIKTIRIIYAV